MSITTAARLTVHIMCDEPKNLTDYPSFGHVLWDKKHQCCHMHGKGASGIAQRAAYFRFLQRCRLFMGFLRLGPGQWRNVGYGRPPAVPLAPIWRPLSLKYNFVQFLLTCSNSKLPVKTSRKNLTQITFLAQSLDFASSLVKFLRKCPTFLTDLAPP